MKKNMFQVRKNSIEHSFVQTILQIIFKTRIHPYSEQAVAKYINQFNQIFLNYATTKDKVLFIEINAQISGKLEWIKIEQWSFNFTPLQTTQFIMLAASDSSQQQSINLEEIRQSLENINPNSLYQNFKVNQTEIIITFDKKLLTPFDGQNTFQAIIDYFEFKEFNCSVNLRYNYTLEQDQDQFQIIFPAKKNDIELKQQEVWEDEKQEQNIRKYSQQVPVSLSLPSKVNLIEQNKLQQVKKQLKSINFQSITNFTMKQALNKYF